MPGNAPELVKLDGGGWEIILDEGAQSAFVRWLCLTYAVPDSVAGFLKGCRGLKVKQK